MPKAPPPDPERFPDGHADVERDLPVGHATLTDWWMSDAEGKRYDREIRDKEVARKALGGFGFR